MNDTRQDRHLDDSDLLRYVDREADEAEVRGWTRHVDECDRCAGAVATLRDESRLIQDWLGRAAFEADVPAVLPPEAALGIRAADDTGRDADTGVARQTSVRTRGRRPTLTPWLRAAAILILLAAPLAAFPSVRSWVAEQVGAGGAGPDASTTAVPQDSDAGTVLRFTPEPGNFTVRFEPGTAGTIVVDRATDGRAVLRARGGVPETEVSSSTLRIRNTAPGRYHLQLPHVVTGAWIMIGQRAVPLNAEQIERRTEVQLER